MAAIVKTVGGLALASVKNVGGLAAASLKTINGQDATAAASNPAFAAELNARGTENSLAATSTITITDTVAQNQRIIVCVSWVSSAESLASATDSRGNTYAIEQQRKYNTTQNIAILSANATTAIQSGDTITLNWTAPDLSIRGWRVFKSSNCATSGQPDQSAQGSGFGTSVSVAANTTASNTTAIGFLFFYSTIATYGSGNWTTIGVTQVVQATYSIEAFYKDLSASGSQNPGGTLSTGLDWGLVWAAYK